MTVNLIRQIDTFREAYEALVKASPTERHRNLRALAIIFDIDIHGPEPVEPVSATPNGGSTDGT